MLTPIQSDILKYIREVCASTGAPPSFREIQKHFGYRAVGTVQDHVKALVKKGMLELPLTKEKRRARNLIPAGSRSTPLRVLPIYGEIAAGSARHAEQLELGQLEIPLHAAAESSFALRVVGNSMIDAGILEGDILIVEKQNVAKNGDIVVALLNGETTVKRYQEKRDGIFLVPENRTMKPIPVVNEDFSIQGKVVGLQRKIL